MDVLCFSLFLCVCAILYSILHICVLDASNLCFFSHDGSVIQLLFCLEKIDRFHKYLD